MNILEEIVKAAEQHQNNALREDILKAWKTRGMHFLVNSDLHTDPKILNDVMKICEEAAQHEATITIEAVEKFKAIAELEHIKKQQAEENAEAGVH